MFSSDQWQRHLISKPLPIYQTILKDHIKINNYLKQSILEHRRKYPKSITSNVKAWHSDWQTHLKDSNFKPFSNLVTDACEYISTYDWNQNFWEFEVIDMWAMVYKESNYAVRHDHVPFPLSGVYYVDVEEGCSPIIFEKGSPSSLTIQPKNGMLIIWHGNLYHEVPSTNKKRMAISMNISQSKNCAYEEVNPNEV